MSNIPTSDQQKFVPLSALIRSQFSLLMVCIISTCTGCWEEVRYEPTPVAAPTTQSPRLNQEDEMQEVPSEETQPSAPIAEELITADDSSPQIATPPEPEKIIAEEPPGDFEKTESTLSVAIESQEDQVQPPSVEEDLAWLDAPSKNVSEEEANSIEIVQDEPSETVAVETSQDSPRSAIAVWQLSSKWSLAAAYFAKGIGADRYGDSLDQAKYAAKLAEVDLPDFLIFSEDGKRQAKIATFLISEAGPRLVEELTADYTEQHAALADLAINTHALLLVYTPLNDNLDTLVSAIHISAKKSALPKELWVPLVELLEQRGSFQDVKQAVFQLHTAVTSHLGSPTAK